LKTEGLEFLHHRFVDNLADFEILDHRLAFGIRTFDVNALVFQNFVVQVALKAIRAAESSSLWSVWDGRGLNRTTSSKRTNTCVRTSQMRNIHLFCNHRNKSGMSRSRQGHQIRISATRLSAEEAAQIHPSEVRTAHVQH
jgi:hypothetical protein